jgi:hypothetical protein
MNAKPWKIVMLTVVTWLIFSGLALGYISAMNTRSGAVYVMVDGQSIIWSWASLVMGIVMTFRLGKKWQELIWGGICFGVCLFPYGFIVGIGYFARCYFELEKKKKRLDGEVSAGPLPPNVRDTHPDPTIKYRFGSLYFRRHPIVYVVGCLILGGLIWGLIDIIR